MAITFINVTRLGDEPGARLSKIEKLIQVLKKQSEPYKVHHVETVGELEYCLSLASDKVIVVYPKRPSSTYKETVSCFSGKDLKIKALTESQLDKSSKGELLLWN